MYTPISKETTTQVCTRELKYADIEKLMPITETWVRNATDGQIVSEEIHEIRAHLNESLQTQNYQYFVITDEFNSPIGMAGFRTPEDKLKPYIESTTPTVEMVNVFLSKEVRGKGYGYEFLNYLIDKARVLGYQKVIWSSGRRYEKTAWDFYQKFAGNAIAEVDEFFGPHTFAKILIKET